LDEGINKSDFFAREGLLYARQDSEVRLRKILCPEDAHGIDGTLSVLGDTNRKQEVATNYINRQLVCNKP